MRLDLAPDPSPVDFAVHVERAGRRSVVVVRGEVDRATSPAFAAALDTALRQASSLCVDLADVTFVDSGGLRALHDAYLRLGQLPEAITLVDPSAGVRRALHLAGLDRLCTLRSRRDTPGG